MKTIFIAGASGFIGKHLLDNLIFDNYIYINKRDFNSIKQSEESSNNLKCFEDLHKKIKFDYVINCIGNTNTTSDDWDSLYEANCVTNLKLMNNLKYDYFIYLSSFSVFSERSIKIKIPDPNNLYGLSKYISEKIIKQLANPNSISIILRLPLVIGRKKKQNDVINYFYNKLKCDEDVELIENGKFLRNIIHYSEILKIIRNIIKYKPFTKKNNIYHCNSSDLMSVFKICKYMKLKMNSNSKIKSIKKKFVNDFNSLIVKNQDSLKYHKKQTISQNLDAYLDEFC
jgi:nucleoside-diphosphate-sugar epimerase